MILKLAISTYLIGMLVFLTVADFTHPNWKYAYFVWDKVVGAGLVVWYLLYKYTRKRFIVPVIFFSLVRLLWEAGSWIFSVHINNEWAVTALFCVLIVITGYLCLKPNGRVVKFLDKNVP